ncbi:hypothetical protein RchiOBHm_Chr6g0262121 [Rosa chinensis]|uniref:Uncharacterized protein n=1 Tax=Rosa chinensis TaxID=74649 RepID=A0A2P6PNM4_ROSCH|nr:hypothetical protein RchiOBHm_Chr6g0262121 [Rosa chinensis]
MCLRKTAFCITAFVFVRYVLVVFFSLSTKATFCASRLTIFNHLCLMVVMSAFAIAKLNWGCLYLLLLLLCFLVLCTI